MPNLDQLSGRSLRREAIISTCLGLLFDTTYIIGFLIPLIMAIMTLLSPCFPPLTTSLLCRPNNSNFIWVHGCILKIGFASLELALCQIASTTANYYLISFLITATSRLWLDCKNLAESGATIENQIIFYRKIQIYEKTFNYCIRDRISLILALLGPLFQIVLGYALIHVANSGNVFILVVCGLMYGIMFTMSLFVFSVTGIVNKVSWYWMEARKAICTRKVDRKTMKSEDPVWKQFRRAHDTSGGSGVLCPANSFTSPVERDNKQGFVNATFLMAVVKIGLNHWFYPIYISRFMQF